MLSIRYHLITTISLFLTLGLGMFIGGSIGQSWLYKTEHHIVHKMFQKYEEQVVINRQLIDQLTYWQTLQNETFPLLSEKNVLYISASTFADSLQEYSADFLPVDLIIVRGTPTDRMNIGTFSIPVIGLKEFQEAMQTPQQLSQFTFHLKALIEGDENEPPSVYHHSGLE